MSSTPVIDVERLNLTYGDFHAVKDLSFQVERGELYALLGTNGAGKTSTLEIIEGHRTATSGTVRVFGKSPRDRRAVRPRMGIMLQESGFSPDLTVRESVRLIGKLTRRTDQVERVLAIVDLTRKATTKVSQLSGGEKRRLDFATAVYGTPELIFLDEPTTGLDIQSRDDLWDAVDRLRENGSTVVLTTHYLEEAQQRADRIGLMHRGTFHRQGTVSELTRTLPAAIRFSLATPASALAPPTRDADGRAGGAAGARPAPVPALALPLQATRESDGKFLIETFSLQKDLHTLLRWAQEHAVELRDLQAGPTRLDDVFRALDND
ncbi:ABC transporter ATP-binding protein [Streptosporangium sp. NPDC002721]|uniref:ABC transporter ATP-binding protein n=1 Tax=Streptosporangium sp. NPDC002721 TaxID=3366188 RepID=UPI003699A3F7